MTALDVGQTAAIHQVGRVVMARVGAPKDRWEIAAQLEVLGYRDIDARDRLGCRDLFEAADRIFAFFQDGTLEFAARVEDPKRAVSPILVFLGHYVDGLMFSLPMVVQGATMLLFGYGLWGAANVEPRTGSAIGLAFIASYIVTSGFGWAIVSRGLYYHYQEEGGLARWSALRIWSLAARVAIAIAVPAMIFNLLYGLLPLPMSFTALAYYIALVFFWLNWSLIYLVGRTPWLVVVLIVSILAVVLLARFFEWPVIAANMAGLAIADVLTFSIGLYYLRQWERSSAGKATANPPRLTVLIYATAQVFLYGLLYSAFIFTDRILAWTATRGREDFPPYAFWVSARYELGMDLALIVVVLLAGVIEHSAQQFSMRLIPGQKRVKSTAIEPFLDEFRSFYRKHSAVLLVCAAGAVLVAALAVHALKRFPDPRLAEGLASLTTQRVFWIAAISYAIFMYALQNILMLMILSRADLAVRATATSLLINIVAGFVVSRSIHYSGSVIGLLAGSIALAILTRRHLRGVLENLDYNYYAAF